MPSAEYQREWRKRHPGKQREYSKKWRKQNPRYRQKYRQENLECVLEKDKEYRLNNPAKIIESRRRFQKTDKCRMYQRVYQSNRRVKVRSLGKFTKEDIKDLYASQGGRCYYCSVEIEEGYHIEHMTPLSRGGRNDVSNVCLACAPCNLKKQTKTVEEFQNAVA